MDKTVINTILALLSVLVLIIPIATANYIEEQTVTNIITVQGSYGTGTQFEIYEPDDNVSVAFDDIMQITASDNPLGFDANNDSVFWAIGTDGVYQERDGEYIGNYLTYTGNGTYLANVNGSHLPISTYDGYRRFYVPLNVSCGELADFDFVRIHTDIDQTEIQSIGLVYQTFSHITNTLYMDDVDSDTGIIPITQTYKSVMDSYPNGTVWLVFFGNGDSFATDSETFSFSVEANTLEPDDYVFGAEFSDFTIWALMMLSLDVFYAFVIIFANPYIDIKYDKNTKRIIKKKR